MFAHTPICFASARLCRIWNLCLRTKSVRGEDPILIRLVEEAGTLDISDGTLMILSPHLLTMVAFGIEQQKTDPDPEELVL